jgi:phosphate/sulfate permease
MFKWMVFFVLILGGILLFVTWVMGIPVPGLDGIQPPSSPFSP